ncbi:MAG: cysteine hydrolase family protein [Marinoscillum sp.]|uniref:cysteine hydrolase family protein n=1 Tax=Marinoscillum sp. TaxID=2024838 RepID=UPI0032F23FD3
MNQPTTHPGPALILIDIQSAFDDLAYWGGERNHPEAEQRASELLNLWRAQRFPIFHIKHCSTTPGSPLHPSHPGNAIHPLVAPLPGETVIEKNVNSAFIGTDLKAQLDQAHITELVIAGLTTDHCVSTTTRMAGNLGFETSLVDDATATFCKQGKDGQLFSAQLIHDTAIASLSGEFAQIVTTRDLLERWKDQEVLS